MRVRENSTSNLYKYRGKVFLEKPKHTSIVKSTYDAESDSYVIEVRRKYPVFAVLCLILLVVIGYLLYARRQSEYYVYVPEEIYVHDSCIGLNIKVDDKIENACKYKLYINEEIFKEGNFQSAILNTDTVSELPVGTYLGKLVLELPVGAEMCTFQKDVLVIMEGE